MEVLEAIRHRRMHRSFELRPVEPKLLGQLAAAAAAAPMAANVPLRRIVIVDDRAIIRTLRQVTPGLAADPPAVIALCSDLTLADAKAGRHGRAISSYIDAGAAAENIALAAVELGLQISFARSCTEAGIAIALGLPESVRPDLLVGVGYATAGSRRPPRRPPVLVFHNQFDRPWDANV